MIRRLDIYKQHEQLLTFLDKKREIESLPAPPPFGNDSNKTQKARSVATEEGKPFSDSRACTSQLPRQRKGAGTLLWTWEARSRSLFFKVEDADFSDVSQQRVQFYE